MKKFLAVALSLVMLISAVQLAAFAAADIDYAISNPYEEVDFALWGQYKANLHSHTNASDGTYEFYEAIEKHYALGYDFLAITDHSTTDYGWVGDVNYVKGFSAVMRAAKGSRIYPPVGLTQERYDEITTEGADGRSMLRVPFGNELNAASLNNTHVGTWFADYGNGLLGYTSDYETALKGVQEAGGISVINHPGEYTGAKSEQDPEKAYGPDYNYYINKFTSLLYKYPSCIGMDMNSKGDGRTKNDRKLWDKLLINLAPEGRNVFGICSGDTHRDSALDTGWVIALMPEKTIDGLESALKSGSFFGGSRCIKNTKELAVLSEATALELGTSWQAASDIAQPVVRDISVDDAEDIISIQADNALAILWIADGEVIATGNSIDLDDYSDKLGAYVRAEIFGEGGILYSQAFLLDYEGKESGYTAEGFFDFGAVVAKVMDTLIRFLSQIPGMSELWALLKNGF